MRWVLEVSDAVRDTHHIALTISLFRSDRRIRNALKIDTSSKRNPEMDEPDGKCKSRMHVGNDP